MLQQPLISTQELNLLLTNSHQQLLLIDATFNLTNPDDGLQQYQQAHLPNAHYLDLDKHLCGVKTGINGRHPLPEKEYFLKCLRKIGVNQDSHVIVYDQNDSMFSAHLWWMLLWVGHSRVQVLNGGMKTWQQEGGAISTDQSTIEQNGNIQLQQPLTPTVDVGYVLKQLDSPDMLLIDARSSERFLGNIEPLDATAGHIPGAANRHYVHNLTASGTYKPQEVLRQEWNGYIKQHSLNTIVHQCGSGVSACHNILSMAYAGFGITSLYPGSWSEWCSDQSRPTEKG